MPLRAISFRHKATIVFFGRLAKITRQKSRASPECNSVGSVRPRRTPTPPKT